MAVTTPGSSRSEEAKQVTGGVREAPGRARIGARTLRTDKWWVQPLITVVILSIFVVYSTVRIFINDWYWVQDYHYLTPLYSPCLSTSCPGDSALLGHWFGDWPFPLPLSIIIFPIIGGFRLTCYYYRKAYFRSFWQSPPACAVAEPHKKYTGERRFPLIVNNWHRYFFYGAFVLLVLNSIDAVLAFHGEGGGIGIGLGTIIIVVNVVMLWLYTLSCHACRHATGGRLKHFSRHPLRYWAWTKVSKLNEKHMQWAWASLTTVIITDLYIMSVSAGWISDLRIIN